MLDPPWKSKTPEGGSQSQEQPSDGGKAPRHVRPGLSGGTGMGGRHQSTCEELLAALKDGGFQLIETKVVPLAAAKSRQVVATEFVAETSVLGHDGKPS